MLARELGRAVPASMTCGVFSMTPRATFDRIHKILQCGDGAGFARRAVHDRCIEFDVAGAVRR